MPGNNQHLDPAVVAWLTEVSGAMGTLGHIKDGHDGQTSAELDEAGNRKDVSRICAICNPRLLPPPLVMEIERWAAHIDTGCVYTPRVEGEVPGWPGRLQDPDPHPTTTTEGNLQDERTNPPPT